MSDPIDYNAVLDVLDGLTATLCGLRMRLIAGGFSEEAAEEICVQQHELMTDGARAEMSKS